MTISECLKNFWDAWDKLRKVLEDDVQIEQFISESVSEKDCKYLNDLVITRNLGAQAFYILLKVKPELAIKTLFFWYLSYDISHCAKDLTADLGIMFDDIKEILGEDKLQEILKSPEFLAKNKRNPKVKEAIAFALDED